ncbi:hypothetical protein RRG08_045106 [Elysia crispata]|uniref:Uncharacterized protein n=1 Tax=Elysia crispata TaxID=231223 RepID=A0AAE0YST8_9GAST|nr:hypothetical protein RRG08_045106 [Elysia crispata]
MWPLCLQYQLIYHQSMHLGNPCTHTSAYFELQNSRDCCKTADHEVQETFLGSGDPETMRIRTGDHEIQDWTP